MKRPLAVDVDLIRKEMIYWKAPGLAVSLVREGEPPLICGFGWRDQENALKVNGDTLFGIASCSKSMTSALIAVLAAEGRLDYDTPVRVYAPELQMLDPAASRGMTLRDMLCHRTGLGGHDALWPGSASRAELAARLRYLQPSAPFRSKAQYSNLIYAMIGYTAERAAGESWEDLMESRVFAPLGMARTSCSWRRLISDDNRAEPYRVIGGSPARLSPWNVDLAGPAASVNSTAVDMAKWLLFHLREGRSADGKELIPRELFLQMHSPQISFEDSSGMGEGFFPCGQYAMGWLAGEYRGRPFQKHMGKIEGYSSIQAYLPEEKLGAAILINLHSPAVPILYTILYSTLDYALGLPPADWAGRFHTQEGPSPEEYRDCDVNLFEQRYPGTYPTTGEEGGGRQRHASGGGSSMEEYAGVYFNLGYGFLRIRLENGRLFMGYRDMDLPMAPRGKDLFCVDGVKEDIYTMSVPFTFIRDGGGTVHSLKAAFEPLVDDIVFIRQGGQETARKEVAHGN